MNIFLKNLTKRNKLWKNMKKWNLKLWCRPIAGIPSFNICQPNIQKTLCETSTQWILKDISHCFFDGLHNVFFHVGLKLGMPAVGRHFWCDFVLLKMFNYFHCFSFVFFNLIVSFSRFLLDSVRVQSFCYWLALIWSSFSAVSLAHEILFGAWKVKGGIPSFSMFLQVCLTFNVNQMKKCLNRN